MNKIKVERVKKLIAALRSGKYKQTVSQLKDHEDDAYCCLGVACDISGLSKWEKFEIQGVKNIPVYFGEDGNLPKQVKEYYGFRDKLGSFLEKGVEESLTTLNDQGKTFKQIAQKIEYCLNHPETEMFVR
jgi:hypothetical protein